MLFAYFFEKDDFSPFEFESVLFRETIIFDTQIIIEGFDFFENIFYSRAHTDKNKKLSRNVQFLETITQSQQLPSHDAGLDHR